jgi:uncharacterized protein YecE (DUF72 family)
MKSRFYVGTSGWTYDHWKGLFYPVNLPKSKWFGYYTENFSTVEINATFYRTFKDQTYEKWYDNSPPDFRFVLKAPKIITHRKYLKDAEEEIKAFCHSASLLKEKFGMILLQLAPNTPYDLSLLRHTLQLFDYPQRVAVEFRNDRWLAAPEVYGLMSELGVTYCDADSPKCQLKGIRTSKKAYLRLHGRKNWYAYNYPDEELSEIALLAHNYSNDEVEEIYIFFNNDFGGWAPQNAKTLIRLLNS